MIGNDSLLIGIELTVRAIPACLATVGSEDSIFTHVKEAGRTVKEIWPVTLGRLGHWI